MFFAFAYKGGSLDGLGEPWLKHRSRLSWKAPKCFGTIRLSSSEDRSKIPLAWSYLEPEVRWPVYFQINTNIPFGLQYFMINIRLPLLNFPYRFKPQMTRRISFFLSGPVDYLRTCATTTTGQLERQKSISQTTTCHVLHGLFFVVVVHFFAVIARPRHETGMLLKRGTASGERKNEKWEQNFLNPSPISDFISNSLLCSHFFIFPFFHFPFPRFSNIP